MNLLKSFYYAISGLVYNIKNERNFRIHIIAIISVIWFSCVYGISVFEKIIISILFSLVLFAELLNTALEKLTDEFCREKNEYAKIVKDSAAAAVLVLAVCSVICAVFIFSDIVIWKNVIIPYIIKYWYLLILFIVLSWFFIFKFTDRQKLNKEK